MDQELDEPDVATRSPAPPRFAAEDRFACVVEASPIALLLAGRGGRIELVNRQVERMFGYDRAELCGQTLELLMPERFRRGHVALRERFRGHVSSRLIDQRWGLFGLRRDGTEFPLAIGLNPVTLDGQAMVLACLIDITARRAVEQEQERQRRELERSNADLDEFAFAASHDLKAPLRAIGHLAEWIEDDVGATASAATKDNLALLRGRVTRLQTVLDGLLAYSRLGRADAPIEAVDVADLVGEIVGLLAPPAGFVVACEGGRMLLRTHRAPLRAVLENLIGNAIKHHDRAVGRIGVAMAVADGVAEFRVSDDGPGIPPRFHDRIFGLFQTLGRGDDHGSGGIGLAIVRKRVQDSGGGIRVESGPPARGTTFVFTWPEAVA
jgi:PAS domain S-box-containing protein